MISAQPVKLIRYLSFRRLNIPKEFKRLFYLSWEDALWDILSKKNVPKGDFILIPEFYCGDVEKNIKSHNYKIIHYPLTPHLTVDVNKFKKILLKNKPKIVVIFHAVGITNNLVVNTKWLNLLSDDVILIEDCVHRIISPDEIRIFKKNHFLINSLRKVVPLQGASLYGLKEDLDFEEPLLGQSLGYSTAVNFLWFLMTMAANLGATKVAENLMINGYDLIGDSQIPAKGLSIFKFLERFIDYEKVTKVKEVQARIYKSMLSEINSPPIPNKDLGKLRGWPIILPIKKANKIMSKIRGQNLLLRYELNDSLWSKEHKITYLPMGPYLNNSEVLTICQIVKNAWQI